MPLYIDPNTGSMLFAVLFGILGALNFLFGSWIVKLRFLLSRGKTVADDSENLPCVIFSDDKRYWQIFDPICREFDSRGFDVVYMTASPDDPALDNKYQHVRAEFIGENNKAIARMNTINAVIVFSTTPGLEVYQWKRSKNARYYVHIPHAPGDITRYRMFGLDYYDAVLVPAEYQKDQLRKLEKLRNLPAKEIVEVGIPYMDEMRKRLSDSPAPEKDKDEVVVLLAPSWGDSAIFKRYGGKIIDVLLETGYRIIIRPHPQSFKSEKDMIERLMEEYPESDRLSWNRDSDNFNVLRESDILISDFSGVSFDFSLVYDKPIIYTDTSFDSSPYDAWWLDEPLWTFTALPRIGRQLTADNLPELKEMIDSCLSDTVYERGREQARSETWHCQGEGAVRSAGYMMNKYAELTECQAVGDAGTEENSGSDTRYALS